MRAAIAIVCLCVACEGATAGTDAGMVARDAIAGEDAPAIDAPAAPTDAPGADAPGADAPSAPIGSDGCGRAAPASGARTLTVGSDTLDYIVSLPDPYDPARPYPLGFGLHGHGRTHANCQSGDCAGFQRELEDHAILIYPRSVSAGWQDSGDVRDRNVALFRAVLDATMAEACVEVGRVFVAGTSSGASFANHLACVAGDRIRAVIPVAGGVSRTACVGTPAALVIHGVDDPHVLFSYGEGARDAYLEANGCSMESDPAVPDLHARVVADRESHECADYRGCDPGVPVRWCEHSEGGYDGSTHGWPLFGGTAIRDFVLALP